MLFTELARAFNVSMEGLAAKMGYSRQSLYEMAAGKTVVHKRLNAALCKLRYESKEMYEADVEIAAKRRARRDAAIDFCAKKLKVEE